jgi:predicted MPP superfamily phosphohydrolase
MPPKRILLILFSLILLLHGYIGWRLLPDLQLPQGLLWAGGIILSGSCILIPVGLLARALRDPARSDLLAWIGLSLMGLFSSILCLTLCRDLLLLLARLGGHPLTDSLALYTAQAVLLLSAAASLRGLFNARKLARVRNIDIALPQLPAALHGFVIVQISDIHVGPTIKRGYLQAIVDQVNALGADMVAITGDLVDGSVRQLAGHTAVLAQLSARYGNFFVTGNHEYYSGAREWISELSRLGIQVLENRHVLIEHQGACLLVAGVTDYSAAHFDGGIPSDPHAALADAPGHTGLKLLLAHQPRTAPQAEQAGFDLQLSGHTHGGQFVPWNWFVPLQQPFTAGLHQLGNLWVYTSRGTGYWGPPMRLFAPSEITRIRLIRSGHQATG